LPGGFPAVDIPFRFRDIRDQCKTFLPFPNFRKMTSRFWYLVFKDSFTSKVSRTKINYFSFLLGDVVSPWQRDKGIDGKGTKHCFSLSTFCLILSVGKFSFKHTKFGAENPSIFKEFKGNFFCRKFAAVCRKIAISRSYPPFF